MTLTTADRRRGGLARAQMDDFQDHQRHAGRCSAAVNDMAALGRKGFDACAAKFGWDFAFERARLWRLEHPSHPEQQMIELLGEQGLWFEREVRVLGDQTPVAVDFYIADYNLVVEVNGRVHTHPLFDSGGDRHSREALRLERIRRAGFQVLVIDSRDLADPAIVRRQIEEFIGA